MEDDPIIVDELFEGFVLEETMVGIRTPAVKKRLGATLLS
jgi:hypothetical protein